MKYQNGVVMTEQPFWSKDDSQGLCFNGSNGWLRVARGYIECSDPKQLKRAETKISAGQYEVSAPHMQNFLEAVRGRKHPIAPVEVGCSTNTLCCIANIATELNRPVRYDPATRSFGDDKEAATHRLVKYEYREAYTM
jgi:hypothetical protein